MEIKLSDYARDMEAFGEDPLYIIQEYIKATGKEIDALGMVVALAANKSKKVVAPCQAKMLDKLLTIFLLGMDIPSQYLDEVKATIPQMKIPQFIFVPMVEWLRDKYGIKFLEQKELAEESNDKN